MKFDLTVIVPAYNEEKRIKKTLEIILNYLQKNTYGYEIIIIEDASTDKTFKIIDCRLRIKIYNLWSAIDIDIFNQ